ncbi:MAG: tyrosine-type recombinase/integrase [bacterium]|nr:tyrosine-type recombinase/integrase [bacterium]MDZ4343532.1 site-specific tyrosine recombinase/integron integrase [Candidatus Binatia bacterium]
MSHNLKSLHDDFLEDLEIAQGRSAKTVENYDHYLRRFYEQQKINKVADITMDEVRLFRRFLNDTSEIAIITQNYHLIALRQFLKYLAKRDIAAMAAEKIGLAKTGEREIDVLYPEEIDALLAAPGQIPPGDDVADEKTRRRDEAILQVLFSTGLRISELVSLDRDDIKRASEGSTATAEMPVRGKGNKVRVVFLAKPAQETVAGYLERRHDTDPALFIRHKKGATNREDNLRLTARSVQRMIKKYAVIAGLTKKITPHTLRHSFATDLLSNGADVRQVQQLLGHASITTTQIYTHLTDVHLRDVHAKFHRRRGG